MAAEQQFCLRWNNHQSTLISVFDNLLVNENLVDCTIAAEGQKIKAHKVVLSACSPYFESLMNEHYNEHPIIILKDIKFQELKAMMDYMYRGEVNISQDQLGALLKAAESLQIKGLSDSGGAGTDSEVGQKRHHDQTSRKAPPMPPRSPPVLPHSSGLTIEHRRPAQPAPAAVVDLPQDSPPPETREGSASPVPRKRRKPRRRSSGGDDASTDAPGVTEVHETSNSSEVPSQGGSSSTPVVPSAAPVVPSLKLTKLPMDNVITPADEPPDETKTRPGTVAQAEPSPQQLTHETELVQKVEPPSEVLIEPKTEYLEEEINEDSIEDLTMEDDDEMDHARPGPSHGGEGSSQGFTPWHLTQDHSRDDVFMAAQEAAHRDTQGVKPWGGLQNVLVSNSHSISNNMTQPSSGSLEDQVITSTESYMFMKDFLPVQFNVSSYTAKDTNNLVPIIYPKREVQIFPKDVAETSVDRTTSSQAITNINSSSHSNNYDTNNYSHISQTSNTDTPRVAASECSQIGFQCKNCDKVYHYKSSLLRHVRLECGKDPQFRCPYCPHVTKHKSSLLMHMDARHRANLCRTGN